MAVLAAGLPNRRVEDWKYTDLRALMSDLRPPAQAPTDADTAWAQTELPLPKLDAVRIVLLNGRFVGSLSDDSVPGIDVMPLGMVQDDALFGLLDTAGAPADNAAVALVGAFAADGVVIRVTPPIARPVHIVHMQAGPGHAVSTRVLVVVEAGAGTTLVESHVGPGAHQTSSLVEVLLGEKASLDHIKLQLESPQTQHLATLAVRLGKASNFSSIALARGAELARQQIFVGFDAEGGSAALSGITLGGGMRHLDTTLVVDHSAPSCESREHFRSVLDGEARAVFQGKLIVRPDAQHTDGKMVSRALLLSEEAEADLKPELEIYADDVQCGHGATTGALDEDMLFFLMSRGIPKAEAEAMLVSAFIGEVLDTVRLDAVREVLNDSAAEWLSKRN